MIALTAFGLLLGACGGDGSDADNIVADYIEAIRDGDATAACATISQSVPESRYEARCNPPAEPALDGIEAPDGELEFETSFSGDRAAVSVLLPDGSKADDLALIVEEGDWKIIGSLKALDGPTQAQALAAEAAAATFASDNEGSYEGMTVEYLTAIDPSLAEADLLISEATLSRYALTVTSLTGSTFGMIRDETGATTYVCEPLGAGFCRRSGYWKATKLGPAP